MDIRLPQMPPSKSVSSFNVASTSHLSVISDSFSQPRSYTKLEIDDNVVNLYLASNSRISFFVNPSREDFIRGFLCGGHFYRNILGKSPPLRSEHWQVPVFGIFLF